MKILLVSNPILLEGHPRPHVPLGILSLATILHDHGHNVGILDINAVSSDPTFSEAPEAILAHDPDVVGFSAWCNMYFQLVKFASILREKKRDMKILFGGVHATYTDVDTIEAFPQIDIVVRGECDHTINDIMNSIDDESSLRQVPGITFRQGNRIIRTPYSGPLHDLNDLPLPNYSLFPSMDLVDCISIDVGRGCPFNCAYCVSNRMSERKVRLRSVESVIEIVRGLVKNYKRRSLRFEHDLLTLNRKWLLRLCDGLIKEEFNVEWSCFSRIDTIDEEMLDRMAAAGCNSIYFGIESGSQRMQELLNKNLRLQGAAPIVSHACSKGIEVTSGFITGFPQEKMDDLCATIRLMMELYLAGERDRSKLDFWLLVPFPGSPLFDMYGDTLSLDDRQSDFAVHPRTLVDMQLVKDYPKIFSTLYHYATEHLDRLTFLRAVYLMLNLGYLRYTSFMLTRDPELGFPRGIFEKLSLLELPSGNIYQQSGTISALSVVCHFIKDVLNQLRLDCHPIHDVIKFDLAWNDVSFSEFHEKRIRVEEFSYDVLSFIKDVKSLGFSSIPPSFDRRPTMVLFRKSAEQEVEAIKMPDLFKVKREMP